MNMPMAKTLSFLLALAIGGLGCSDSASISLTDGAPATTDAATTGDDGATAGCNFPSCMSALGAACVPDGDCVSQVGTSAIAICYANGLRYVEAVTGSGSTATAAITATNGPTACFTGNASATAMVGTAVTYTLKNSAGVEIATMTQDISTGATSITCKGEQPVALNPACSGGGSCSLGTCP
jgi:hypothetical protein